MLDLEYRYELTVCNNRKDGYKTIAQDYSLEHLIFLGDNHVSTGKAKRYKIIDNITNKVVYC